MLTFAPLGRSTNERSNAERNAGLAEPPAGRCGDSPILLSPRLGGSDSLPPRLIETVGS
jgi:hypothetical protein